MDLDDVPGLLAGSNENGTEIISTDFGPVDIECQLEQFRQEWKQEITGDNSAMHDAGEYENLEKEATAMFLMGSKMEQDGALYEAVKYYRRAMQLVPDIEMKIQYPLRSPRDRQESESSLDSFDDEDLEIDLVAKFQCLQVEEKQICSPGYVQRACHVSALPIEVLIYIFKWVVSSQLDMKSLENISQVCRGFYLCARDEELWRLACLRIWGCNTGKMKKYGSWRSMYIDRPHLLFVGCYISKMAYFRQGEKSLDNFYSPWHHVEYYRYMRFFSEGQVLMMTSPEDPTLTVSKFRSTSCKVAGMLSGVYKISGNRVTGVLKRIQNQDTIINRCKRNKNQKNQNEIQQTYNIELEIHNIGKRNGFKLAWSHYSVRTFNKVTGDDNETEFELTNKTYPPLVFSRVTSFLTATEMPLRV